MSELFEQLKRKANYWGTLNPWTPVYKVLTKH